MKLHAILIALFFVFFAAQNLSAQAESEPLPDSVILLADSLFCNKDIRAFSTIIPVIDSETGKKELRCVIDDNPELELSTSFGLYKNDGTKINSVQDGYFIFDNPVLYKITDMFEDCQLTICLPQNGREFSADGICLNGAELLLVTPTTWTRYDLSDTSNPERETRMLPVALQSKDEDGDSLSFVVKRAGNLILICSQKKALVLNSDNECVRHITFHSSRVNPSRFPCIFFEETIWNWQTGVTYFFNQNLDNTGDAVLYTVDSELRMALTDVSKVDDGEDWAFRCIRATLKPDALPENEHIQTIDAYIPHCNLEKSPVIVYEKSGMVVIEDLFSEKSTVIGENGLLAVENETHNGFLTICEAEKGSGIRNLKNEIIIPHRYQQIFSTLPDDCSKTLFFCIYGEDPDSQSVEIRNTRNQQVFPKPLARNECNLFGNVFMIRDPLSEKHAVFNAEGKLIAMQKGYTFFPNPPSDSPLEQDTAQSSGTVPQN